MTPQWFEKLDQFCIARMRRWGIPLLRIALGVVFLWFGLLKVFGVSPVEYLIKATYSFLPLQPFITFLGVWEVLVGLGLIFGVALRLTLALLWLQMAGTFVSLVLSPTMFFSHGNLFLLTTEGEFVIKNLVLITAGLVIGGHEVKKNLES